MTGPFCTQCGERKTDCDCDNGGNFLVSAAVAAATDSALLGTLIGGDVTGAVLGDILDGDLMD